MIKIKLSIKLDKVSSLSNIPQSLSNRTLLASAVHAIYMVLPQWHYLIADIGSFLLINIGSKQELPPYPQEKTKSAKYMLLSP
jgi:hypothetical protein